MFVRFPFDVWDRFWVLIRPVPEVSLVLSESESELFTGDTSKDNHSPGPVFREVSP